jgi:SAM-dependent methyltransferase
MTSPIEYLDELYQRSDDPWGMRERWYERRKRDLTLAVLPCERYRSGFEPGCANGELAAMLALRCDRLLVADVNETAVQLARKRLEDLAHVRVEHCAVPSQWPDETFDLVVISELAYYLDDAELSTLAEKIRTTLSPDGTLLACHWRRAFAEALHSAEVIHALLDERCGFTRIAHHDEPDLLLDVWSRDARSVAQHEGIA